MLNRILKRSVGVDVSDRSIEVVEVRGFGGLRIRSAGRVQLEEGVLENGRIKDEARLLAALTFVFAKAKPRVIKTRRITLALPESQVYTHIWRFDPTKIALPASKAEEALAVLEEVRHNIPLDSNDMAFGYRMLAPGEVLVLAASRGVLLEWERVFKKLNIVVETFDTETLALLRNLFKVLPQKPTCVVDIGARVTHIMITDEHGLKFTRTIPVAGEALTAEISTILQVNKVDAEDRMIKLGLSAADDRNMLVLIKALEPIEAAIRDAASYYAKTYSKGIDEIVLTGGSSRLIGLPDYLATNLGVAVRLGSPVVPMAPELFQWLEAAGIALREFGSHDPALRVVSPSYSKSLRFSKRTIYGICVAIVACVLVAVGVWYFMKRNETLKDPSDTGTGNGTSVDTLVSTYSKNQTIPVSVVIETDAGNYDANHVRGRVVKKIVETGENYKEAVVRSAVDMEQELKADEKLWSEPLGAPATKFPVTISWLVYSHEDVERLALIYLKSINTKPVPYREGDITAKKITEIASNGEYRLDIELSIEVDELVEIPKETQPERDYVVVGETETGWLNVRERAVSSSNLVQKILPGERYTLLGEEGDWYQLDLGEGKTGWVSKKYVTRSQ